MLLNVFSVFIGCIALVLALPAFLPLLGWANWAIIPIAFVGLAFGVLSDRKAGRFLNMAVIVFSIGRLWLGGGIF